MSTPFLTKTGLGVIASLALPAGFMAYRQVAAMPERNEKMRGGLSRIGFWGGLAATATMGLKIAGPLFRSGQNLAALSVLAVATTLPVIGYETFKRIGNWAFPSTQPSEENGLAPQTIPEDLISNQVGNVTESGTPMQGPPQISPQWNGPQIPPQTPPQLYGPDAFTPSWGPAYSPMAYNTGYTMMPSAPYSDPMASLLPPPSSFLPTYGSMPMMRPY